MQVFTVMKSELGRNLVQSVALWFCLDMVGGATFISSGSYHAVTFIRSSGDVTSDACGNTIHKQVLVACISSYDVMPNHYVAPKNFTMRKLNILTFTPV